MASQTAINPNSKRFCANTGSFPAEEFAKQAHIKSLAEYQRMYQRSVKGSGGILGGSGERAALVRSVAKVSGVESAVGEVVRRGQNQLCYNCVDRHVANGRADRRPSCGRASQAKCGS